MRSTAALVSCLVLVSVASANVQIFYTAGTGPYGLTDPSYAFIPTNGNHTDIGDHNWQVNAFPPTMTSPTVDVGDTLYLWLKFSGEPNGRKVYGLAFDLEGAPSQVAYYLLDDTAGQTGAKRWDGAYSLPHAPEFQIDPRTLSASTAEGLTNLNANQYTKLYAGGSYRTALLGAVRYTTPGTYHVAFLSGPIPYLYVGYPQPTVEFGMVTVVPEPASLLLLTLAVLAVRRR